MEKILILDENRGIYIPQAFFQAHADEQFYYPHWGKGDWTLAEMREICSNPDNEEYWDAWTCFCENVAVTIDGQDYRLEENGDLWGIPIEWRVLSPDGFDIQYDTTYKTIAEAQRVCKTWLDRIIAHQGYYSMSDRTHLDRDTAYAMCEFEPITNDENDEEE